MENIEILKSLVSFDTKNDKENNKIINYIEQFLSKMGFKTITKSKILIMEYKNGNGITFIGHSDTVEITNGWNSNPLEVTIKKNKIYGLGVCDMKGGIACFLAALKEINLNKIKDGIRVIITYDEEISFNGIKDVLNFYKNNKMTFNSKLNIIGEPTNNEFLTGCKGLYAVELYTKGIKVHSSNPDKGKSAIDLMIKILLEIKEFYEINIKNEKYDIYEINNTTMNIGMINGGSSKNSVSQSCLSYIDFRIADRKHIKILKDKLKELCKEYKDFSYIEDININPFYNEIKYLENTKTANFMTEASFIKGKKVIIGPGPVTAHEVNEYITIKSFEITIKQYIYLIKKNCY